MNKHLLVYPNNIPCDQAYIENDLGFHSIHFPITESISVFRPYGMIAKINAMKISENQPLP